MYSVLSHALTKCLTKATSGKKGVLLAPGLRRVGRHDSGSIRQLATAPKKQREINASVHLVSSLFSLYSF